MKNLYPEVETIRWVDDITRSVQFFAISTQTGKDLLNKYDKEDTLFYLDPPYVQETRRQKVSYNHEMRIEKHEELVDNLLHIKGKVILSGYDHEVYKPLEDCDWNKVLLGEYSKSSQKENDGELTKGKEFVWVNFTI